MVMVKTKSKHVTSAHAQHAFLRSSSLSNLDFLSVCYFIFFTVQITMLFISQ